uniref:choice-of-anchor D domain-containing protein n=1 Tax=Granulicella sp. L56 TaxID=1747222 RepID=UPI00131DC4BA
LTGTGTTALTSTLTVAPSSLTFGAVTLGSTARQTVILTATGTAAVTINSATIAGTGFTVSGATFPVVLNPSQTLTLTVQFAPTADGAATATLTLDNNSTNNPTPAITLTGTGTTA